MSVLKCPMKLKSGHAIRIDIPIHSVDPGKIAAIPPNSTSEGS